MKKKLCFSAALCLVWSSQALAGPANVVSAVMRGVEKAAEAARAKTAAAHGAVKGIINDPGYQGVRQDAENVFRQLQATKPGLGTRFLSDIERVVSQTEEKFRLHGVRASEQFYRDRIVDVQDLVITYLGYVDPRATTAYEKSLNRVAPVVRPHHDAEITWSSRAL